jgi:hypothetical protein
MVAEKVADVGTLELLGQYHGEDINDDLIDSELLAESRAMYRHRGRVYAVAL